MRSIPNKLILPLPSFLTREYLSRATVEELFAREEFVEYMMACDELVTTSDEAQFYLDLFSVLMLEDRFLPPTDRHFSATIERAKDMQLTIDRIERGIELAMSVSGPNEALPNVFVAYEFLSCVRQFAEHATGQVARRQSQRRRMEKRCSDLHQLAILTFVLAIKVQLGLEAPDCWQRPDAQPSTEKTGPAVVDGTATPIATPTAAIPPASTTPIGPERQIEGPVAENPQMNLVGNEPEEDAAPRDYAKEAEGWTIWNSTNLLGKANMILCWYWDGETDSWQADKDWLRDGMKVVRRLIEGKDTSRFRSDQWFAAYDPIASYPEPDEEIEKLRETIRKKYEAAAKAERR